MSIDANTGIVGPKDDQVESAKKVVEANIGVVHQQSPLAALESCMS